MLLILHYSLCTFLKGVTMSTIFSNPAGSKIISFIWVIENTILKKKNFPTKIASGEALFPPLEKATNQLQNFEKHLKHKRCVISCLNVPNFCYFSKKNKVDMVQNVKNCSKSLIMWKLRIFKRKKMFLA